MDRHGSLANITGSDWYLNGIGSRCIFKDAGIICLLPISCMRKKLSDAFERADYLCFVQTKN